jgi:DNA-binding NarL/FixJ family response regulator
MNIALIDDHSLFAEGLKTLLSDFEPEPHVSVYHDCESALNAANDEVVDLVLLDYYLSGLSQLEALDAVRQHFPHARIVVVSALDDASLIRKIIEAGAAGFIPKTATYAVLTAALQLVAAGGTYLPAEALEETAPKPEPSVDATVDGCTGLDCLSKRQQEVLLQVVQGMPNKKIAQNLNISEHTVKAHVSASFRLLGVSNRTEAVYAAAKLQRESLARQVAGGDDQQINREV